MDSFFCHIIAPLPGFVKEELFPFYGFLPCMLYDGGGGWGLGAFSTIFRFFSRFLWQIKVSVLY